VEFNFKKFFLPALFFPFFGWTVFSKNEAFFVILIGSIVILGLMEFYNMVEKEDWWFLGLFGGIVLVGGAGYGYPKGLSFLSLLEIKLIISGIGIFFLITSLFSRKFLSLITKISPLAIAFGLFYVGWLLSHLILIKKFDNGCQLLLFLFAVVWSADAGGWLIGRHIGKHKNIFFISPNKSLEGLVGAIFTSVIVSIIFRKCVDLGIVEAVSFGILFSSVGILGDLCESSFKRNVGKKDSDSWITEYGGILDVFDSIILSAPVFYYLLIFYKGA